MPTRGDIDYLNVFGAGRFILPDIWCQKSSVLDLGLISIASLGPRASTKVESHVNFTESQKVSQPNFFCNIKHKEVG